MLDDPDYRTSKERRMEGTVISEAVFNQTVQKLLDENETGFPIADDRPDLSGFRKIHMESVTESNYNRIVAREGGIIGFKLFPGRYVSGAADRVMKSIRRRNH